MVQHFPISAYNMEHINIFIYPFRPHIFPIGSSLIFCLELIDYVFYEKAEDANSTCLGVCKGALKQSNFSYTYK